MSRDGYILWARSSAPAYESGIFFRTRNMVVPVPIGSLALTNNSIAPERQGIELAIRTWFPKEPKDMTLREMKIVSDRYEQTMSLLILPKAEPRWMRDSEEVDIELPDNQIQIGHLPRS